MFPNLKLQLWKMGIRQNRLAQMLKMDETLVSRIVNGFREPSPDLRHAIAMLLKEDEVWLFEKAVTPSDGFQTLFLKGPDGQKRPLS